MHISFNPAIPHLAIKPKEIIKNVYKALAKIRFIRVWFIEMWLDCPSFLPADKGRRGKYGETRDSEEENQAGCLPRMTTLEKRALQDQEVSRCSFSRTRCKSYAFRVNSNLMGRPVVGNRKQLSKFKTSVFYIIHSLAHPSNKCLLSNCLMLGIVRDGGIDRKTLVDEWIVGWMDN